MESNPTSYGDYEEIIFSKWATLLLSSVTIVFLGLSSYQLFIAPIGTDPAPDWFWLIMFLLFLGITVNFSRLKISIDSAGITIGFGILKNKVPWTMVEECYLDETSSIWYGGWGMRISRVNGKWRKVYNIIGGPRVVISLDQGWIREIAFSTSNPEEVRHVIKRHLGM
ncbi:MAG: hypothetical protein ACOC55_05345 [Candidatus Natronoplasma sp.]